MHFQVRTDNHIENSDALAARLRGEVEGALHGQYGDRLRRVEIYLQDVNSHKGGTDKRCSIEAHLAGLEPVVVHEIAPDVDAAVDAAVDKLSRAMEKKVDRLGDRNGRTSMSGEPT